MSGIVRERLKSVESLVPYGTRLLDVGSDHAALPISLFNSSKITSAVISDVNEKPLERAKTESLLAGVGEKCDFVLSDGFENINPDSFDVAAVCGMGGVLISSMIERGIASGRLKKAHILILQPMTDVNLVRKCLWDNGYEITDELFSLEGKYDDDMSKNRAKPYVVIKGVYDGKMRGYTFRDLLLGKILAENKAFLCFKQKTKRMLANRTKGILLTLKAKKEESQKRYVLRSKSVSELKKDRSAFKRYMRRKLLK